MQENKEIMKKKIEQKDRKKISIKKVTIVALIAVICMLIVWYDLKDNNNIDEIRNQKIVSYLNGKYNQDFEVLKLVDSRQYENSAVTFDGATFFPSTKAKDKYEYYYEVLSKKDKVKFNLYYLDDKGKDTFEDSYIVYKNVSSTFETITNHIIKNVGSETAKSEVLFNERKFSLLYDADIEVYLTEKLDEELNYEYIYKLQAVNKEVYNMVHDFYTKYDSLYNEKSDADVVFNVNIHYADDKVIKVNEANLIYVKEDNSNSGIDINSYFNKLQDKK